MSVEIDELAKQCIADIPGADNAMGGYLLKKLPRWIRGSFDRLTPQDVDELTSLCAIHILGNIESFRGDSSFDTWARPVARNKSKDWLRTRALRWKRETSLDIEDEETGVSRHNVMPSRIRNPREELDLKEVRELTMTAFEKVRNSRYKLILEEFFISGLTLPQIARLRSEPNIDRLYRDKCRALKALLIKVKGMPHGDRLEEYSSRLLRRY